MINRFPPPDDLEQTPLGWSKRKIEESRAKVAAFIKPADPEPEKKHDWRCCTKQDENHADENHADFWWDAIVVNIDPSSGQDQSVLVTLVNGEVDTEIEGASDDSIPDSSSWTPWGGGDLELGSTKCPVDAMEEVEVRYRGGEQERGCARSFRWFWVQNSLDIIWYRKVESPWVSWNHDAEQISCAGTPLYLSPDTPVELLYHSGNKVRVHKAEAVNWMSPTIAAYRVVK